LRVAIIGVGSIGGILLGALADTNADIICVSRGRTASNLSDMGLVLHTPEGSIEVVPSERYLVVDSESGPLSEQIRGTCDVAIICGKTLDTPALTQIASEVLTPEGYALTIQNGLGNAEILAHRIGRDRVFVGSITHAAWRNSEGVVHWVGRGCITFGALDGSENNKAEYLLNMLNDADLNAVLSDDIQQIIWKKLLINVAINPVCAIAGVRNGALLEINSLWQQSMQAMREAAIVARASGVDLGDIELETYLRDVVVISPENRCSMLQDIMAGRPTEIDALCGAVVLRGEAEGIPTPCNAILHGLIKGIENSSKFD
jgi:2-dehydropantoate 2-reductase|tara:strand:+ start:176 stop:1126 length:951 start_codon:yes stop_codon:yes gene_type:complete